MRNLQQQLLNRPNPWSRLRFLSSTTVLNSLQDTVSKLILDKTNLVNSKYGQLALRSKQFGKKQPSNWIHNRKLGVFVRAGKLNLKPDETEHWGI